MVAIAVTAVLSVLATTLYFVLTRRRRIPDFKLDLDQMPEIDEALYWLAGTTGGAVARDNSVECFENGALLQALLEAVKGAQHTIHFETFVWTGGQMERDMVTHLCERAAAGVTVRVLLDALGSINADPAQLQKLREGGVQLQEYCKVRWWNWRRFNHRTHRKLLIIDGNLGFTFGHGIADQWLGNAEDQHHWRDIGVCIRGPAVQSLQAVFVENWVEETHSIPLEPSCFLAPEPAGDISAHVVSSATGDAISSVGMLYTLAIACARREIYIQNPYFAPERSVARLLGRMVARGVAVHLMIPGRFTDSPFVRRAGCALYGQLLEAGVHIYEFEPTLLHQKIVVVDGAWSHVGSTNFDARALALNEEVGVGILDKQLANHLIGAFNRDLERSREIKLSEWRHRRWYKKFIDQFAYLLRDQM